IFGAPSRSDTEFNFTYQTATQSYRPASHLLDAVRPRLISFALCPFVHRATTMLREKGVEFDIEYIDLRNKPEWFLALSPLGKVPGLVVEGGTALFESAAINEFLDETEPPRLLPTDPVERARHRAWIEIANDLFSTQYKLVHTASTKEDYQRAFRETEVVLS